MNNEEEKRKGMYNNNVNDYSGNENNEFNGMVINNQIMTRQTMTTINKTYWYY